MKLAGWASIDKEIQRELILDWHRHGHWEDYESLAVEAAKALRKALASNPDITGVQLGGGEMLCRDPGSPLIEIILNVCTASSTATPENLPSVFEGFPVRHLDLAEKRHAYLQTWKRLFKELKGWSEAETLIWAKNWNDALDGRRESAIYHYGAVKIAVSGLIDQQTREIVGNNVGKLENELASVIWLATGKGGTPEVNNPDVFENYDWVAVRSRVEEILEKYRMQS